MPTSKARAVAPAKPPAKKSPAAKAKPSVAASKTRAPIRSRKAAAPSPSAGDAGALIDAKIASLGDWRGAMLARIRAVITTADPAVIEEWKWATPVWSCDGLICTGEAYKKAVKMTFAKGAALADPAGLFNSSLDGNVRRAIDVHEGDTLDETALKALIRAAVALNRSSRG